MYKGAYTAIVTPFTADGTIDEAALERLVEEQIAGGIDGLVPVGTTGESPTLSHEEHVRIIELVVRFARGRCPIIAGTGSNSTDEAVDLTKEAARVGASATLQVAPYYNKPMQEGLYQHFKKIALEGGLPVIVYDIPGRTGVSVAPETIVRLAKELPGKVVGLKEATGTTARVGELRAALGPQFSILSGDDSLAVPMMEVGADGVISVASNVIPQKITEMVHLMLSGEKDKARALHESLLSFFKALFIETNPIPVKAALAMQGKIEEMYRLPLSPMSEANRKTLESAMRTAGLLSA